MIMSNNYQSINSISIYKDMNEDENLFIPPSDW